MVLLFLSFFLSPPVWRGSDCCFITHCLFFCKLTPSLSAMPFNSAYRTWKASSTVGRWHRRRTCWPSLLTNCCQGNRHGRLKPIKTAVGFAITEGVRLAWVHVWRASYLDLTLMKFYLKSPALIYAGSVNALTDSCGSLGRVVMLQLGNCGLIFSFLLFPRSIRPWARHWARMSL